MKHTGLTKPQAYAPKKVTGKHRVDWAYLSRKHKSHAIQIKAHKHDLAYLLELKKRLEK